MPADLLADSSFSHEPAALTIGFGGKGFAGAICFCAPNSRARAARDGPNRIDGEGFKPFRRSRAERSLTTSIPFFFGLRRRALFLASQARFANSTSARTPMLLGPPTLGRLNRF